MKQIVLLLICAVLLLSCMNGAIEPTDTVSESNASVLSTVPGWDQDQYDALREKFPVIDGSTSLIPLDVGIRTGVLGMSESEARQTVKHSQSWTAFNALVMGGCEVLLSVPISPEQHEFADNENIALEGYEITREGFVFIVNKDNPVNTLTQEQLRRIYTGEITNWSDLGGDDAEILPYQRNSNSGSHNFMLEFMEGEPLMNANLIADSMIAIIETVDIYKESRYAIGYSVYTYAADMYSNADGIRFIAVDGVKPSKETMADGSYPLTSRNYAYIRADSPEDSGARLLVKYLLSADGQHMAAEKGYVPAE